MPFRPAYPRTNRLPASNELPPIVTVRQPPSDMLALRVSALDMRLGHAVFRVCDLLRVQDGILKRQDCARRAIDAAVQQGTEQWPAYLVNPIGFLARWPRPYAETPVIAA